MSIITTSFDGGPVVPKPKPFAWSYSRLKNFEVCPSRYHHVDVLKDFKEDEGEALQWGNAVHKALADRISKGTPLPKGMGHYEKWAAQVGAPPGKILVEQQLAIDKDFGPTKWFASDAKRSGQEEPWYRGIGDVVKIADSVALVVDWKTGKILDDSQQLALMAACIFAHFPSVIKVRSEFIWLKEDARTRGDFHRNEMAAMWKSIWPRIEALKHAHDTNVFPVKPGYLCKRWCPVTSCPHNGD